MALSVRTRAVSEVENNVPKLFGEGDVFGAFVVGNQGPRDGKM